MNDSITISECTCGEEWSHPLRIDSWHGEFATLYSPSDNNGSGTSVPRRKGLSTHLVDRVYHWLRWAVANLIISRESCPAIDET